MKKKIKISKGFLMSCIACLIPIVISLIFYEQLPDQVATHFNSEFVPDGYSPKWVAAFGIPLFMLFMNALVWITIENDPKKKGIAKPLKEIGKWTIPVLSLFVHISIIAYAINGQINIIKYIPFFVGILFTAIGNYLPKCRQNYTAGIRLPWTLNDEENWTKTHRFAGKLWVAGGIIMILASFSSYAAQVIFPVIILLSIVPVGYSFWFYKKTAKDN